MDNTIKEKLRKILEIANRGGTEAEAETALKMAHELLAKHNLTMNDVQTKAADQTFAENEFRHNVKPFTRSIWNGVAQLYFCDYWTRTHTAYGQDYKVHSVIGTKENAEMVEQIALFLIQYGEKLGRHLMKAQPAGTRRSWLDSFLKGYAFRIKQRCFAEVAEAKAKGIKQSDPSECRALMVVDLYNQSKKQVEVFKAKNNVKLKTNAAPKSRSSSGFYSGDNAGKTVSLKGNGGELE